MVRGKVLKKEFPFLSSLKENEFYSVKKLGSDVLKTELWKFAHSWAGSRGCTATVFLKNGQTIDLPFGLEYSDNGRITVDEPSVILFQAIDEMELPLEEIGAILIHEWDCFNNPTREYDDFYLYINRGNIQKLKEEFQKMLLGEIQELKQELI